MFLRIDIRADNEWRVSVIVLLPIIGDAVFQGGCSVSVYAKVHTCVDLVITSNVFVVCLRIDILSYAGALKHAYT